MGLRDFRAIAPVLEPWELKFSCREAIQCNRLSKKRNWTSSPSYFLLCEEDADDGTLAGRCVLPRHADCLPKLPMSHDQRVTFWNCEPSIQVEFCLIGLRIAIVAIYDRLCLLRDHVDAFLRSLGFTILPSISSGDPFEIEISQVHVPVRQDTHGENIFAFAETNVEKLRS